MKKKYGILAYPASHSLSPAMHNAGFEAIDFEGEYEFFERSPAQLAAFMEGVRSGELGIWGLSVSLPHKVNIMPYLDEVSEDARLIGAVNTVVRSEDGKLKGYNTDHFGAVKALEGLFADGLKHKLVVILGAGGSARAVAYGMLKAGAHVWIKNRTKAKADRIAIDFAEHFKSEIHSVGLEDMGTADILINTTSVWLGAESWQETALVEYCDAEYLRSFDVVMDIVYKPLMTPLLDAAAEAGVEVVTGDKMLLYQAVKQFELWTGKEAPMEAMWEAIAEELD